MTDAEDNLLTSLIKSEDIYQNEEWCKQQLTTPHWEEAGRVHNWRSYVPDLLKDRWATLMLETRIAILVIAEAQAEAEDWD